MIPVTKDNIRKILERASLFEESHICLQEHVTSFTPTKLAPKIYTKDEINEMVTGICGAQEKLGDELKTLVDDTYQPLDRGYNELFRSMAEMRTEIESMQHILEKEATTSPSIDANKATSIDVKPQTSQIPAEPESLAEKKDEWEIAYINTKINDVYNPLNNNVDWLSTRIDLLQQDLDTIRKKDQQPATSIDICTITSIDSKFAAMEDSWADSGFHESFAVETVIPSSNEDPTEEYDEDYWKERAIEIAMQDERYSSHSFNNTSPPSIDRVYSASVDTHPHPAKRSYASIDTTPGTSINIKAAAFEKEKGNIPIPSRYTNTYIRSFAPQITSHDTIAERMNAPTNKSEGTSRKSIRSKNPNSADKRLGPREDIADIRQLANGPYNLFMQQRSIPDNIPAVPDEHPRADTTEIGSYQSCQPVGQTSIDKDALTSFDRAPPPSIDRRYECGRRAYEIYGARKFRWEQKDEYGVYRDESGYARSVAGEMIPITKDNIRKIMVRASLFEESHICLPEHATSFTPTKPAQRSTPRMRLMRW
ncbi:hypothetical protein F2Q69_00043535 [Brassica cretica]|uniref:Uncharacterized protein n=1 Tax=Brassica cretica TaxID=69181 RepID=A0A8S9NQF5_BRACR|nr:hypothetical protein F2Q69_00043535 [Brassica cretica]